jgi:tRNA(Ile)-lysidine synthase
MDAAPVGAGEFEAIMRGFAPFENAPRIAVAVSGGPDSMALALLLAEWAKARRGKVVALTVDHGLRRESHAEAKQVGRWLGKSGIEHAILHWPAGKPAANIQSLARAARYRLLEEWSREQGILHCALGHQLEDQAETFVLRLARGSGLDGLAGMPTIRESAGLRWIRPLLAIPRARIFPTLLARSQDFARDPSNRNRRFARVRVRDASTALAEAGITVARIALAVRNLARARRALEADVAGCLAESVSLFPEGYARLDLERYMRAAQEVQLRVLARLLGAVGGGGVTPRLERLSALHNWLCGRKHAATAGRTLARCRIMVSGTQVLLVRETVEFGPALTLVPGEAAHWDGRFLFRRRQARIRRGSIRVKAKAEVAKARPAIAAAPAEGDFPPPKLVWPSLPAVCGLDGEWVSPHLLSKREHGRNPRAPVSVAGLEWYFRPTTPIGPAGFTAG